MIDFEKWQIGIGIAQTIILLITVFTALRIGLTQNKINQKLLNLNYIPSVEVNYENKQINVINKGQTNLFLWGTQLADAEKSLESASRLVTPNGSYYLLTDKLEAKIIKNIGANGQEVIPLNIFIETQNEKKYVIKVLLFIKVREGDIKIHTQTTSTTLGNWV